MPNDGRDLANGFNPDLDGRCLYFRGGLVPTIFGPVSRRPDNYRRSKVF